MAASERVMAVGLEVGVEEVVWAEVWEGDAEEVVVVCEEVTEETVVVLPVCKGSFNKGFSAIWVS